MCHACNIHRHRFSSIIHISNKNVCLLFIHTQYMRCVYVFLEKECSRAPRVQYLRASRMVWVWWFSFIHSKEFGVWKSRACRVVTIDFAFASSLLTHQIDLLALSWYRNWQSERKNGNNNNKVKRVYSTRCTLDVVVVVNSAVSLSLAMLSSSSSSS